ncbi:hypothetical protein [Gordonia shandongensis]|uniref:hypothetical protein n=1 Tax=Gordonia shandongensis TaxID=376351 RepID=UPI0005554B43|nr:hypothetical protein [Gordonia shandongensis]
MTDQYAADERDAGSDRPVLDEAANLLEEAEMVRAAADAIDLGALSRQAELLTAAHDRLASALENAGRG